MRARPETVSGFGNMLRAIAGLPPVSSLEGFERAAPAIMRFQSGMYRANVAAEAAIGRRVFRSFAEAAFAFEPDFDDIDAALDEAFDFGLPFSVEATAKQTRRRFEFIAEPSDELDGAITLQVRETASALSVLPDDGGIGLWSEALWDALPHPAWRRDAETLALIGANKAYWKALGIKGLGKSDLNKELGSGVIAEFGRALARRAVETGRAQTESHHIIVEGRRRLLDFTETYIERADIVVGFAVDQTPLEEVQLRIADTIATQDAILEKMVTGIAIFGPDRRLQFFNKAYSDLWALSEKDLADEPTLGEIFDLLFERRMMPETVDVPAYKRFWDGMFTNLVEIRDDLMYLPDERTIRITIAPHPSGGLVFTYEEVTDRVKMERSFNTLTKVQQATLNNLYEGVAVFGADGRLKLHNDSFLSVWALGENDVAASPHISELLDRLEDRFINKDEWRVFKAKRVQEVTQPRPNAGRMELSQGQSIDYSDVPLPDGQCLTLLLDVTDTTNVRRALEERNAALRNAEFLKAQFISNMSYELRTPLTAIIGFTEMLEAGIAGQLNAQQRNYASNALAASRKLAVMVNDLLSLAAIQAGFIKLDVARVSVFDLVQEVAAEAVPIAAERHVSVAVAPIAHDLLVECDSARIRQALIQLATNAVKFAPSGGWVRLGARRVDQTGVALTIADSGTQISREDRLRVIDNFVQASSEGSKRTGVGLGLALSKSLIDLHGGRIEIHEPKEEGGTDGVTCICYLPSTPPAEAIRKVSA